MNCVYDKKKDKLVFSDISKAKIKYEDRIENQIDGGVSIDHPYRFTNGLESAHFSPHLHTVHTGWIDGKLSAKIEEKTGWVIANKGNMKSWHDCYNLVRYLLSHSAAFMKAEGKRSPEHSVRYFGECHNKKFKVSDILRFSKTGYDQLESILLSKRELRKKENGRPVRIPLQKVSYTHSIIKNEIKDSDNDMFYVDHTKGNINNLSRALRIFITPHTNDNPACSQSELKDFPSLDFLQLRFDYGYKTNVIVQSVYQTIILDPSLIGNCPGCSSKFEILVPKDRPKSNLHHERIASMIKSMEEDEVLHIVNVEDFEYLRNSKHTLGMSYFDLEGIQQFDTGIYVEPECLNLLSSELFRSVIRNINVQTVRYEFKVETGRTPTKEEVNEELELMKSNSQKSLDDDYA